MPLVYLLRILGIAFIADTGELDMMTKHLIVAYFGCSFVDIHLDGDIDIVNFAAVHTPDVVVGGNSCIKPLLGSADFQFQDEARFRHEFEVSVDRAKADAG